MNRIARLSRLLLGELPAWARPNAPHVRQQIARLRSKSPARRRIVAWGLGMGLALAMSATFVQAAWMPTTATEWLWRALYYPLLSLQLVASLLSLLTATRTLDDDPISGDASLRSTERGAALALRARWAAGFYRLRMLLFFIYSGRALLVAALLIEVSAMRGSLLDIISAAATPSLPLWAGFALLAAALVAALLLPLSTIALEQSAALWVSAAFRNSNLAALLKLALAAARAAWVIALSLGTAALMGNITAATLQGSGTLGDWALLTAYSASADWGLLSLQLQRSGDLWAIVPYAAFIPLVMLGYALLQSALSDLLLAWASRLVERPH